MRFGIRVFLVAVLSLATGVSASPPMYSAERLKSESSIIIVGALIEQAEEGTNRSKEYVSSFRVLAVEKGSVEVGDVVTGAWWYRESMPMQLCAGGFSNSPGMGSVVRVHIDEDGDVLMPNGFGQVEPVFMTESVFGVGDLSSIEEAAESAIESGALREAAMGYERALIQFADTLEVEDEVGLRVKLGDVLYDSQEYLKAADVLEPVLLELDPENRDASRTYLYAVWEAGDEKMYLNRLRKLSKKQPGEWKEYYKNVKRWLDR